LERVLLALLFGAGIIPMLALLFGEVSLPYVAV